MEWWIQKPVYSFDSNPLSDHFLRWEAKKNVIDTLENGNLEWSFLAALWLNSSLEWVAFGWEAPSLNVCFSSTSLNAGWVVTFLNVWFRSSSLWMFCWEVHLWMLSWVMHLWLLSWVVYLEARINNIVRWYFHNSR